MCVQCLKENNYFLIANSYNIHSYNLSNTHYNLQQMGNKFFFCTNKRHCKQLCVIQCTGSGDCWEIAEVEF